VRNNGLISEVLGNFMETLILLDKKIILCYIFPQEYSNAKGGDMGYKELGNKISFVNDS